MTNDEYKELIQKHLPKEDKIRNAFISFFIGGLMGVLGQVLIFTYTKVLNISYSAASSLMMVTFIFFACLFTALGFFDNLVMKAGAGLFIPITGFAHSTTASALEYKKEGLVFGIGSNIFKLSGSVILYGTISAYFFGIIRFLFFGG